MKHIEDEQREEIIRLIMELYLQCYSVREIADELARRGIEISIGSIEEKIKVFRNRQMSKTEHPDSIQYYNVWKTFQLSDDQLRYPGQNIKKLSD
ncbi:MAG: recombinase family protein [Candidatus Syntropharchaeia archaeon]